MKINLLKQTHEKNSALKFTTELNVNLKNSFSWRLYWLQKRVKIHYIPIKNQPVTTPLYYTIIANEPTPKQKRNLTKTSSIKLITYPPKN